MTAGEQLRAKREKLGLTLKDVAEAVGRNIPWVQRIEGGQKVGTDDVALLTPVLKLKKNDILKLNGFQDAA